MIDLDADIAAIFENGDFDTAAAFTISVGNTLDVQGWFTGGTEQANPLTGQIEAVLPMFDCPSANLEQTGSVVRKGMSVTINGTAYTVERLQKLGVGITSVHLKT